MEIQILSISLPVWHFAEGLREAIYTQIVTVNILICAKDIYISLLSKLFV